VGQRLWAAVAAGEIGDQEAEQLDVLLRTRTAPSGAVGGPRTAAVPIHMLARPCGTGLYSLPSAAPRTHWRGFGPPGDDPLAHRPVLWVRCLAMMGSVRSRC